MARTKRNVPYKHYWGRTRDEWKEELDDLNSDDTGFWKSYVERNYKLFGTDTMNFCYPTHEYYNRANRVGRRIARDQLRPHIVLSEDYDFDDSRYRAKYKGVWWEIY